MGAVGVLAFGGLLGLSFSVIAVVAHAFGIVLKFNVGTKRNLASLSFWLLCFFQSTLETRELLIVLTFDLRIDITDLVT